jgi:hypothetical protein
VSPLHFYQLKWMARSAAHCRYYMDNPRKETLALRLGQAVDAIVFKTGHVLGWSGTRRGKDWNAFEEANPDAIILNDPERALAFGMIEALQDHRGTDTPDAMELLNGVVQDTLCWNISGRDCVGTPDVWTPERIVDLKTTRNAEPNWFARDAMWRGYHSQLAWYRNGLICSGLAKPKDAYIVAVESAPPHPVVIRQLTDRALDQGDRLWRIWLERFLVCEASNEWPGYVQSSVELDVPDDDELILKIGGEDLEVA